MPATYTNPCPDEVPVDRYVVRSKEGRRVIIDRHESGNYLVSVITYRHLTGFSTMQTQDLYLSPESLEVLGHLAVAVTLHRNIQAGMLEAEAVTRSGVTLAGVRAYDLRPQSHDEIQKRAAGLANRHCDRPVTPTTD